MPTASCWLVEAPSLNWQPRPLSKKAGIPSQGDEEGIPIFLVTIDGDAEEVNVQEGAIEK